jgi:hypothetical protein
VRSDRIVLVNDRGHAVGEGHHRAKLSDHEVWLIHELRESGMSYRTIAAKFDVCTATVCYICQGQRRGQLPVGQRKVGQSK